MTAVAPRWDPFRIALGAAVLTTVWRVQDLVPGLASLRIPTLAILAVGALLVLSPREQHHAGHASRSPLMIGVLLLLALAALSVPTSLFTGLSARFLVLNLLPTVLLAVAAAAAVQAPDDGRRLAAVQVAGATLYAAIILVRFDPGASGRLGALIHYDANDIAMLLVCTLPLALYFVEQATSLPRRLLAVVALVLFLVLIARSGSRGAFLALVAVTGYLLVRATTVPWRRRVGALVAVAAILGATAGAAYWSNIGTILTPRADYNWIGNTEAGRMAIWTRGIGYMRDRPFTGVGLNAFPIAEGTISPLASRQMFGRPLKWSAAHSAYVQVGAELGVLALAVFLATVLGALVAAGRLATRARRLGAPRVAALARALAAALIGYLVGGAFLSQAYAPFLFVTIGTVAGLDITMRRAWSRAAVS